MAASKKTIRHAAIRKIIETYNISTQEELCEKLNEQGFEVTQATASRDIKELRLSKMTNVSGNLVYHIPTQDNNGVNKSKYVRILSEALVSMETAENILVIKTVSGMAMAAAAALDNLKLRAVVGCIAGDDTIMCAIKTKEEVPFVMRDIELLLGGE